MVGACQWFLERCGTLLGTCLRSYNHELEVDPM